MQNNSGSVKGACGPHTLCFLLSSKTPVHTQFMCLRWWACCSHCWKIQRHSTPFRHQPSALRLLPLAFPGQPSASTGLTLASTGAIDMKPGKQRVSEPTLTHTEAPSARLQLHPLHPGLCSLCTSRNTHRPSHRRSSLTEGSLAALSLFSLYSPFYSNFLLFPRETSVWAFMLAP